MEIATLVPRPHGGGDVRSLHILLHVFVEPFLKFGRTLGNWWFGWRCVSVSVNRRNYRRWCTVPSCACVSSSTALFTFSTLRTPTGTTSTPTELASVCGTILPSTLATVRPKASTHPALCADLTLIGHVIVCRTAAIIHPRDVANASGRRVLGKHGVLVFHGLTRSNMRRAVSGVLVSTATARPVRSSTTVGAARSTIPAAPAIGNTVRIPTTPWEGPWVGAAVLHSRDSGHENGSGVLFKDGILILNGLGRRHMRETVGGVGVNTSAAGPVCMCTTRVAEGTTIATSFTVTLAIWVTTTTRKGPRVGTAVRRTTTAAAG